MRSRIYILAVLIGLMGLAAAAPHLNAQEIGGGMIVTARTTVPVYNTPPEGAFYKKGAVVDSARTGDRLRVIETREVTTLSTRYLWLKVSPVAANPNGSDRERRVGWVYSGPVGGASNFQIAEGEPSGRN